MWVNDELVHTQKATDAVFGIVLGALLIDAFSPQRACRLRVRERLSTMAKSDTEAAQTREPKASFQNAGEHPQSTNSPLNP